MELPRIRIEVERMRYQITHAFASHNEEIKQAVEDGLTKALSEYDFEGEIKKVSTEIITTTIKDSLLDYFRYGAGRETINKAVIDAIQSIGK